MSNITSGETDAVIAAYDFTAFGRIIDIAGGHGGLLSAVLASSPGAAGVLFDLPQVMAIAATVTWDRGVAGRCELVSGDMFTAVRLAATYISSNGPCTTGTTTARPASFATAATP